MVVVVSVRKREPAISLNLFDSQKKISLDFLCITAENVSYSEPGVIRVYDVFPVFSIY